MSTLTAECPIFLSKDEKAYTLLSIFYETPEHEIDNEFKLTDEKQQPKFKDD